MAHPNDLPIPPAYFPLQYIAPPDLVSTTTGNQAPLPQIIEAAFSTHEGKLTTFSARPSTSTIVRSNSTADRNLTVMKLRERFPKVCKTIHHPLEALNYYDYWDEDDTARHGYEFLVEVLLDIADHNDYRPAKLQAFLDKYFVVNTDLVRTFLDNWFVDDKDRDAEGVEDSVDEATFLRENQEDHGRDFLLDALQLIRVRLRSLTEFERAKNAGDVAVLDRVEEAKEVASFEQANEAAKAVNAPPNPPRAIEETQVYYHDPMLMANTQAIRYAPIQTAERSISNPERDKREHPQGSYRELSPLNDCFPSPTAQDSLHHRQNPLHVLIGQPASRGDYHSDPAVHDIPAHNPIFAGNVTGIPSRGIPGPYGYSQFSLRAGPVPLSARRRFSPGFSPRGKKNPVKKLSDDARAAPKHRAYGFLPFYTDPPGPKSQLHSSDSVRISSEPTMQLSSAGYPIENPRWPDQARYDEVPQYMTNAEYISARQYSAQIVHPAMPDPLIYSPSHYPSNPGENMTAQYQTSDEQQTYSTIAPHENEKPPNSQPYGGPPVQTSEFENQALEYNQGTLFRYELGSEMERQMLRSRTNIGQPPSQCNFREHAPRDSRNSISDDNYIVWICNVPAGVDSAELIRLLYPCPGLRNVIEPRDTHKEHGTARWTFAHFATLQDAENAISLIPTLGHGLVANWAKSNKRHYSANTAPPRNGTGSTSTWSPKKTRKGDKLHAREDRAATSQVQHSQKESANSHKSNAFSSAPARETQATSILNASLSGSDMLNERGSSFAPDRELLEPQSQIEEHQGENYNNSYEVAQPASTGGSLKPSSTGVKQDEVVANSSFGPAQPITSETSTYDGTKEMAAQPRNLTPKKPNKSQAKHVKEQSGPGNGKAKSSDASNMMGNSTSVRHKMKKDCESEKETKQNRACTRQKVESVDPLAVDPSSQVSEAKAELTPNVSAEPTGKILGSDSQAKDVGDPILHSVNCNQTNPAVTTEYSHSMAVLQDDTKGEELLSQTMSRDPSTSTHEDIHSVAHSVISTAPTSAVPTLHKNSFVDSKASPLIASTSGFDPEQLHQRLQANIETSGLITDSHGGLSIMRLKKAEEPSVESKSTSTEVIATPGLAISVDAHLALPISAHQSHLVQLWDGEQAPQQSKSQSQWDSQLGQQDSKPPASDAPTARKTFSQVVAARDNFKEEITRKVARTTASDPAATKPVKVLDIASNVSQAFQRMCDSGRKERPAIPERRSSRSPIKKLGSTATHPAPQFATTGLQTQQATQDGPALNPLEPAVASVGLTSLNDQKAESTKNEPLLGQPSLVSGQPASETDQHKRRSARPERPTSEAVMTSPIETRRKKKSKDYRTAPVKEADTPLGQAVPYEAIVKSEPTTQSASTPSFPAPSFSVSSHEDQYLGLPKEISKRTTNTSSLPMEQAPDTSSPNTKILPKPESPWEDESGKSLSHNAESKNTKKSENPCVDDEGRPQMLVVDRRSKAETENNLQEENDVQEGNKEVTTMSSTKAVDDYYLKKRNYQFTHLQRAFRSDTTFATVPSMPLIPPKPVEPPPRYDMREVMRFCGYEEADSGRHFAPSNPVLARFDSTRRSDYRDMAEVQIVNETGGQDVSTTIDFIQKQTERMEIIHAIQEGRAKEKELLSSINAPPE